MADIRPFRAYRPAKGMEDEVAALPYDVFSREEAKAYVQAPGHEKSFLRIDRAESQFPDEVDTYDERVYQKAREMLDEDMANGTFVQDPAPYYYIYEQTWNGRSQTGIVACASIDDYLHNVIRKHENTVEAKEQDRIHHVDTCDAQTGPIFLAYRDNADIDEVTKRVVRGEPVCDFISEGNQQGNIDQGSSDSASAAEANSGIGKAGEQFDGTVRNRVWIISDSADIEKIRKAFSKIDHIYIADGHHRAASAVKVGLKRRKEHPDYNGTEEFNYFLSVLFPENELKILDYNRVVNGVFKKGSPLNRRIHDNGGGVSDDASNEGGTAFSRGEILSKIRPTFNVTPYKKAVARPQAKGEIGMYMEGSWYMLTARNNIKSGDAVKGLDVSLLQNHILEPIFGIKDPRTDPNIEFVGGIRGTGELVKRADESEGIAFLMYPTSIRELFAVADSGRLMPPKSTWFEPKLLSGLFIHKL